MALHASGEGLSCKLCHGPQGEETRILNGCDRPAEEVQATILCPRCDGQNWNCGLCQGSGEVDIYTCPMKAMTPKISHALILCGLAMDGGTLPAPGGWLEQTQLFLSCFMEYKRYWAEKMKPPEGATYG